MCWGRGRFGLRRWMPTVASVRILRSLGMTETGRGEDDSFLGEPSFYRRFRISAGG
ncbi:hypothetical protein GCM10009554_47770 [Kribbella koreensis]|uniref:Uncharacterized protein n=1 Tax=Kribbella koreensis TaxID=57909 RepID=A0ABN1QYU1_9ACTN